MATVRATYVGQQENGTTFLGDFSSALQDCHAGDEVDLEITHVGQEEKREEAATPTEGTEPSQDGTTDQPAQ